MFVIDHAGIPTQAFPGLADAGEAHLRIAVFFRQYVLGFPDGFAPDLASIADFDLVVLDVQVNRFVRFTLDDQHVVARHLQFAAEFTAPNWSRRWRQ